MVGVDKFNFKPNEPLTRAEAYTIIIRLLGFENSKSYNKNYTTGYKDIIPYQPGKRLHIYSQRIRYGRWGEYFYPNRQITKRISQAIIDFINYLQKDLK